MWNKLHNRIINLSLQKKTFFILTLMLFLNTLTLLLGVNRVAGIYKNQLNQTIATELSNSGQDLSQRLQTLENLSLLLLSNETIQKEMTQLNTDHQSQDRSKINKELRSVLRDYSDSFKGNHVNYINLFCDSFMTSDNTFASINIPDHVLDNIRLKIREAEGRSIWVRDYANDYGLFLGREIREIANMSLAPLGEIIINIDVDALIRDTISIHGQYDSHAYLLLDDDNVLYHSEALTSDESHEIQKQVQHDYQSLYLNGHHYLAIRRTLPHFEWNYICLVSYDSIFLALQRSNTLLIYLMLLGISLTAVLTLITFSNLNKHISRLGQKMLLASEDLSMLSALPADTYDYSHRGDEIGIIHQQFDRMILQLQDLIQENYVNELEKKEAQLQALQSQINPHFLYNTLESINWRARMAGATDISEMVQSLAGLLRITLRKDSSRLTLNQELTLLENYLRIQKYRFDDRLNYSIQVEDSIRNIHIPCLCLQPLVENAIRYGLEDNIDDCEIQVEGWVQKGLIHLIVRNTGSEFEDNTLERLREETLQPQGNGIGLLNIDERIRLSFGADYGLHLYNENNFAVGEIIIPETE